MEVSKRSYTINEYLDLEIKSLHKNDFYNGKIIPRETQNITSCSLMASISTNLNNALDKSKKEAYVLGSDSKIWIEKYNSVVYPDCSVFVETLNGFDKEGYILTNPILLIEVLSKSSNNYDRGKKFEYYRSIPSFKEYMIIYQTIPKVQTWYKEAEDLWRIGNYEGLETMVKLHSIGVELAVKDIYKRIKDFPENIIDPY